VASFYVVRVCLRFLGKGGLVPRNFLVVVQCKDDEVGSRNAWHEVLYGGLTAYTAVVSLGVGLSRYEV